MLTGFDCLAIECITLESLVKNTILGVLIQTNRYRISVESMSLNFPTSTQNDINILNFDI